MRTFTGSLVLLVSLSTVVADPAADPVAAARERPTCQGKPATIVGTTHDIVGTEGDDVIVVLATGINRHPRPRRQRPGVWWRRSRQLFDGPGRDRFYGGAGEDGIVQESVDRDFFDGGPGFDADQL